jgi:hypothetical protein
MNLNDLIERAGINPEHVIALRHRPTEPGLNKVLPWLAAERHDLFNAYQQTQNEKLQEAMAKMVGAGYVASFIGRQPGTALFIGLYSITGARPLNFEKFWQIPAHSELKAHGMKGWAKEDNRDNILWFDLEPTDFCSSWKGKLIVSWPPPERSWWRRAHRNDLQVLAILEDCSLDASMPAWDEIDLSWGELKVLPTRWKSALSQWRAIYYIFDTSDGKGYVGSAYGAANLLGRWQNYAADGHGGNKLLRSRSAEELRFTILQRVSPDAEARDVIRLEQTWKDRLHTRAPYGLNDN